MLQRAIRVIITKSIIRPIRSTIMNSSKSITIRNTTLTHRPWRPQLLPCQQEMLETETQWKKKRLMVRNLVMLTPKWLREQENRPKMKPEKNKRKKIELDQMDSITMLMVPSHLDLIIKLLVVLIYILK
jgi:hypothetical protein